MESERATDDPITSSRETARQARRFLLLGIVCLTIDFSVYHFLAGRCGVPITTAKELSYGCTIAMAFWGNKFWTFNSRGGLIRESILALLVYAATFVVNAWLNGALFSAFSNSLDGEKARHVAFLLATLATTVLNFAGMKFIAFAPAKSEAPHTTH